MVPIFPPPLLKHQEVLGLENLSRTGVPLLLALRLHAIVGGFQVDVAVCVGGLEINRKGPPVGLFFLVGFSFITNCKEEPYGIVAEPYGIVVVIIQGPER